MNLFLYIVSGLAVATIVTGCVLLYVGNDGTGQHTSGDRSFRAPKVGARRQVTVRLDLHRQRSANLWFRLMAGEGIREAWTSRYAPPIIRPTSVLEPLPAGVIVHDFPGRYDSDVPAPAGDATFPAAVFTASPATAAGKPAPTEVEITAIFSAERVRQLSLMSLTDTSADPADLPDWSGEYEWLDEKFDAADEMWRLELAVFGARLAVTA